MTIQLFAQPYSIEATGFYFSTVEEYEQKAAANKTEYGEPVEEYELQFIDGENIDAALADAWGLNQANFARFLEVADEWDEYEKHQFIIAVGECGYSFDYQKDDSDQFEVDIYYVDSMRELAEQFVDEGLYGEIPESLQFYIDYDKIARDLSVDYTETTIAYTRIVYRCG